MSKRFIFLIMTVLVLAALACNAPFLGDDAPEEQVAQGVEEPAAGEPAVDASAQQPAAGQPTAAPPAAEVPAVEQSAVQEAPPALEQPAADEPLAYPIGMQAGLNSLNSYHLVMHMANNGPTAQDISETQTEVRYDGGNDARYMWVENAESTADDPELYTSIEETYQIGLQTCSVSTYEGTPEATFNEVTPLAHDMTLATSNLFDVSIAPQNPTFVGAETVNGIPANHFTFEVTGLGDYSGQEVTQASGDYWVAQDGQYLVKYALVMEVRSAPEGDPAAEVMYSQYSFDLLEANQPQSIVMPPECAPQ